MDQNFKSKVYKITDNIPKGKVATYGQIAQLAGSSKSARVVGMLMRSNPNAPATPCHRVVSHNGELTGYSGEGGISKKAKMLEDEGVQVINGKVPRSFFWSPNNSIDLI